MQYKSIKQYSYNIKLKSNSGSSIYFQYKNRFVENEKVLVKVGRYDLYEKIQAHKDDTDIYHIIERYLGGDLSVLDSNMIKKGSSFFADLTEMPNNLNDLNNFYSDVKDKFDVLPVDVKSLFDNNFMKFADKVVNNQVADFLKNSILNQKYNFDKVLNKSNLSDSIKNNDIKGDNKDA